jgi:hypothetical protein
MLQIMNIFIDILSEDTVKNLTGQAPPMAKTDMDLSLASPMGKYQPMTPLGTFDNPFLSRALYLTRSAGTPSQSLLGGTPLRSPARGTAEYRQAALTAVRARCALLFTPFRLRDNELPNRWLLHLKAPVAERTVARIALG